MIGMSGKDIIANAITLEDGESITIPCESYQEMENMRSQLYKRKKTLEKSHKGLADCLFISREIGKDTFTVFVTKEKLITKIFITGKDGSIRPLKRIEMDTATGENEQERMVRLMREDGLSEEEIEDALAERGEDDFDKAATAIEESQKGQ